MHAFDSSLCKSDVNAHWTTADAKGITSGAVGLVQRYCCGSRAVGLVLRVSCRGVLGVSHRGTALMNFWW